MNSNSNRNLAMIDPYKGNNNRLYSTQRNSSNNYYANNKIKNDMEGEGVLDIARGAYEKVKSVGKKLAEVGGKVSDAYGSQTATFLKNLAPDSDENARKSYLGEKHAILQLPNGKYGMASYMGPNTELIKRLRRNGGDPPRGNSDKASQAHDIRFALAQDADTKEEQIKQIRRADNKMVDALNRVSDNKSDSRFNIELGRKLIQGKILAEEAGLMKKGSFGGDLKKLSKEDRELLTKKERELDMEGYGKIIHLPAQELKMKIMKQYSKKGNGLRLAGDRRPMRGKGTKTAGGGTKTAGKGLKLAGNKGGSFDYKMSGKGLKLAGNKGGCCKMSGRGSIVMRGKGGLVDFVKTGLLPNLTKDLGINVINPQPILNIIKNADPKNMKDTASILSKALMPYLMKGQVDNVYNKNIAGSKIMSVVKELPADLYKKLEDGILKSLLAFSEMAGQGLKLSGGSWAGFWSGFKKAFKFVVKNGLKVGGVIAGALGHPEVSAIASGLGGLM